MGFYVPGMFFYDGRRGRFPALSVTGPDCALGCGHCQGKLLEPMIPADDPQSLIQSALNLHKNGALGILISGGCDGRGRLPWARFKGAIESIKQQTSLLVAVHTGFVDRRQAGELAAAGVDVAMFDVIGDEETLRLVYGLDGRALVADSLMALVEAGLEVVPHVVVGLHHGRIKGEERAVEMIAGAGIGSVVFVVFMPLKGTPMARLAPVDVNDVVGLMARIRIEHPDLVQHLGCAKPRGKYHRALDCLAIKSGVNHVAIPAPEAVDLAEKMGLETNWSETCCAVGSRDIALITARESRWTARTTYA